ncbi:MAG: hypothetical protein JO327_13845 [Nitrososphaeraceae archaeon]|nr:hypothetical protein [Nitrososphaeraceae archaeon]MBV9669196.1 hypothetical protein [Nitrososphaeraceae archaeon]
MTTEIKEIKTVYRGLQTLYNTYLAKADPGLIDDLLLRQEQNPNVAPFYMVEAFTKPGTDSETKRNLIFEKTGVIPAVYDSGTHYAANHRLTLEMLKEISNDRDVLEVTGEYTGGIGGWGASHEHNDRTYIQNYNYSKSISTSSSTSLTLLQQRRAEKEQEQTQYEKTTIDTLQEIKTVYRGLQTLFETYLPKADPVLIHDLLVREQQNPNVAPFYIVEIFTRPGTDSETMRNMIMSKTQMVPAIYDKGTHYVTNQRLTLETLKEISDSQDVMEVTGEYTGGITARGASHEHRDMRDYF